MFLITSHPYISLSFRVNWSEPSLCRSAHTSGPSYPAGPLLVPLSHSLLSLVWKSSASLFPLLYQMAIRFIMHNIGDRNWLFPQLAILQESCSVDLSVPFFLSSPTNNPPSSFLEKEEPIFLASPAFWCVVHACWRRHNSLLLSAVWCLPHYHVFSNVPDLKDIYQSSHFWPLCIFDLFDIFDNSLKHS